MIWVAYWFLAGLSFVLFGLTYKENKDFESIGICFFIVLGPIPFITSLFLIDYRKERKFWWRK